MTPYQFRDWLKQFNQSKTDQCVKKPLLMGIINVTPDSFYDGGVYPSLTEIGDRDIALIEEGVDIIDIGGESSRPGAIKISLDVELKRVIPVIKHIRSQSDICISIDTCNPRVMIAAVVAGADIINDIHALRAKGALETVAQLQVPVCLMHMQGEPGTMQTNPVYPVGVVKEIMHFFEQRIQACIGAGIDKELLILDPGIGFGKQLSHNLKCLQHLKAFNSYGLPVLLGASRKSFIGNILNKVPHERLIGSLSVAVYAMLQGTGIIRIHDVAETKQALDVITAIYQEE